MWELFGVFNTTGKRYRGIQFISQVPDIRRRIELALSARGQLHGAGSYGASPRAVVKLTHEAAQHVEPTYNVAEYVFRIDRIGKGYITGIWADLKNTFGRQHTGHAIIVGSPEYIREQLAWCRLQDKGPTPRSDGTVIAPVCRADERDGKPDAGISSDPLEEVARKGYLPVHAVPTEPFIIDPRHSVAGFAVLRAAFAVRQRVPDPASWTAGTRLVNPETTGRVTAGQALLGIIASLVPWGLGVGAVLIARQTSGNLFLAALVLAIAFAPLASYVILKWALKEGTPSSAAMRRDGGRFAFLKLIDAYHGVKPGDVTFELVGHMARQYELIGSLAVVVLAGREPEELDTALKRGRLEDLLPDEARHLKDRMTAGEQQCFQSLVASIISTVLGRGLAPSGVQQVSAVRPQWSGNAEIADADGHWEPPVLNPATGLPTVAGIGSPDVAGNTYGTMSNVLNPGSGLPTVAGAGSPDVGGNDWGSGPGFHEF